MNKLPRYRFICILSVILLTALCFPFAVSGADTTPALALDFSCLPSNAESIGGSISVEENAHKNSAALSISKDSGSAVIIPLDGITDNALTIAGWFKVGGDIDDNAAMLELYRDKDNFMTVIPFSSKYHNGLSIRLTVGGTKLKGTQSADNILSRGSNT
ncbi:MAG: hypothetical protein J6I45_08355, partial [Clostridia bacterium]|nr:hypothetical protein [Clostridia bacterium]